ncbi:hypothetical protein XF14_09410 [Burkholderia gladioli]|nr:hypothetical protein XF14_09410 [Burkholderia gladioli]
MIVQRDNTERLRIPGDLQDARRQTDEIMTVDNVGLEPRNDVLEIFLDFRMIEAQQIGLEVISG